MEGLGLVPGYWLCVARLLPYENADMALEALGRRRGGAVVVLGEGPGRARLRAARPPESRAPPAGTGRRCTPCIASRGRRRGSDWR